MIGNLLHVFEADKRFAFFLGGIKAGGTLIGDVGSNGFENNSASAGFKKFGAHIIGGCHGGGGEEKRILAFKSAEIYGKIG
jgi:hypothetical protein